MSGGPWIVRPCGLLIRDHKLLWMRYLYSGESRYNLPGGNLEANEEIREGLRREFMEEVSLEVTVGALLGSVQTVAAGRGVLHLLFAVNSSGLPQLNPDETKALELVWLSAEQAAEKSLYPALPQAALKSVLAGKPLEKGHLGMVEQPWL
ncbi:NUDIX hydrolase [Magnetococcus sp. PR-3]|uniref:NUDIX hydrolase n=1 Tax=Magnetococcus sp. PR-3 TaxID=3120355 RepID=UPI002FCDFB10